MYWIYFLLCSQFTLARASADHPIHETRTEIYYREESKRLEIAIRILTDDLEEVLKTIHKETVEIGTDYEHPKAEVYITNYINKHFSLKTDTKKGSLEFVGREVDEKDNFALWIYFKVEHQKRWTSITIENSLLNSYQRHQENIVTINAYGKSRKIILRSPRTSKKVYFR